MFEVRRFEVDLLARDGSVEGQAGLVGVQPMIHRDFARSGALKNGIGRLDRVLSAFVRRWPRRLLTGPMDENVPVEHCHFRSAPLSEGVNGSADLPFIVA